MDASLINDLFRLVRDLYQDVREANRWETASEEQLDGFESMAEDILQAIQGIRDEMAEEEEEEETD